MNIGRIMKVIQSLQNLEGMELLLQETYKKKFSQIS